MFIEKGTFKLVSSVRAKCCFPEEWPVRLIAPIQGAEHFSRRVTEPGAIGSSLKFKARKFRSFPRIEINYFTN